MTLSLLLFIFLIICHCLFSILSSSSSHHLFRIINESSIAAGIRRIEAVTGTAAYKTIKDNEIVLKELSSVLKTTPDKLVQSVQELVSRIKYLDKELSKLKLSTSKSIVNDIILKASELNGIKIIAEKIDGMDPEALRTIVDSIKGLSPGTVAVLGSDYDNKASFVVAVTPDLIKRGFHAGVIIDQVAKITNGGGGGRPDLAQAGGKDPSKIDDALKQVINIVKKYLKKT